MTLRPPEGHVAAAQAGDGRPCSRPPTDLLTPRTEERPERSDEVLIKSQERPDDRFDLPPPG